MVYSVVFKKLNERSFIYTYSIANKYICSQKKIIKNVKMAIFCIETTQILKDYNDVR